MNFALDRADAGQLLAHLRDVDASFQPPLSSRVDLADYADKMAARARRVEAWRGDMLVGVIAMYANDPAQGGFITNVSVLPGHQGEGLAGALLTRALALAVELRLPRLRLEVYADNTAALALYRRHGFVPETAAATGPTLFLHREL
jgi:ribosomal protein S18 acetylase RimI-like enzyme